LPKTLIWRNRPFFADKKFGYGKAKCMRKLTTSSFPSRAVACSTVLAFIFITAL